MKKKPATVALLSDFGEQDHYVATMKGVISTIAPHATIVDITHSVRPQDVHGAAFIAWASYRFFPPGTIFAIVVDPGVGSDRKIICVKTGRYVFLAPDNGVLKYILADEQPQSIIALQNSRLYLPHVSPTFHGRDIFAPVCARLATGTRLARLGPRVVPETSAQHFLDAATAAREGTPGRVIYIDRFGNVVTNIRVSGPPDEVRQFELVLPRSILFPRRIITYVPFYAASPDDLPFFTVGSSGLLEISVKNGSASRQLETEIGTQIDVVMSNDT